MRGAVILSVCLLALVAVLGVADLQVTAGVAEEYMAAADTLQDLCAQKNWQRTLEEVEVRCRTWAETEAWLQMLVNHEDTDAVAMALLTIRAGAEAQDAATALAGCHQLREAAEHIRHRDNFTLGNIL